MTTTKLLIVIAILASLLGFVVKDNFEKRSEINDLKDSITAYNKAEEKSIKTITEIREVIKNVEEPCDCYNQKIPEEILKYVQGKD